MPHLLFYGPPGTGKTTLAHSIAHRLYDGRDVDNMILELNSSDDRGIDTVREEIKTFCQMGSFKFHSLHSSASNTLSVSSFLDKGNDGNDRNHNHDDSNSSSNSENKKRKTCSFKLVILDEVDAMTNAAQNALRRIMEKYVKNVRFILICNYANNLIPALHSRCTRFRLGPLKKEAIAERAMDILRREHVKIDENALNTCIRIAEGDMRRVLHILQASSGSGHITEQVIYSTTGSPNPQDLLKIYNILLSQNNNDGNGRNSNNDKEFSLQEIYNFIFNIQMEKSIALEDINTHLSSLVATDKNLKDTTKIYLLLEMGKLEQRLSKGASEKIQLASLIGMFKLSATIA